MRIGMLVATVGMMVGAAGVAISVAPAAIAQQAEEVVSQAEQQLQEQIVALAQAGNTAGIQELVGREVAAGRAQLVARVTRRVAAMGADLAGSDTATAAALVQAAVVMASDSAVSAADNSVVDDVGGSAASAVRTMTTTDPARASQIEVTVASSGSPSLQVAYVNAPIITPLTTPTLQVGQLGGDSPDAPAAPLGFDGEPVLPVIVEPNPSQTGSPT